MLNDLKERALDDQKNFWPVSHWQPERDEEITPDLCLKVVAVQSVIAFALVAVGSAVSGHEAFARFGSSFAIIAVALFVAFYGLMRVGLATLWNRRARSLKAGTQISESRSPR